MLNWKEVLDWKFEDVEQAYDSRDAILYALGLGYGHDPMDESQLRYLYEAVEGGQRVVPSFSVVLGGPGAWMREPRTGIDWVKSLHGEQGLVVHAPLPARARVVGRNRVTGIIDKGPGKGSLLLMERDIVDAATGTLLATRTSSSFLRGDGGCGAPAREQVKPEPVPARAPDIVHRIDTRPEAALIYRLSGDYNPVHASPATARKAGFERPILHGLCTFGLACRALLATVCGHDPSKLRTMNGRFSAPVYPGETQTVEIWQEAGGRVRFRTRIEARNITAFDFGEATIA
ncbi:MAG: 3-alpha,7-alpha,12-alpha-trihydroxy-5-beta-cholest-24-enoyl-CoA hydratase [Comamonadaceae bacterium]|nr:MAG: 3-alpha,7-alpha,12-alpha-trihydroxy-5-beta-cholest-24-enoyl-CoA hydratase [Comamonadaceae bacterium]